MNCACSIPSDFGVASTGRFRHVFDTMVATRCVRDKLISNGWLGLLGLELGVGVFVSQNSSDPQP